MADGLWSIFWPAYQSDAPEKEQETNGTSPFDIMQEVVVDALWPWPLHPEKHRPTVQEVMVKHSVASAGETFDILQDECFDGLDHVQVLQELKDSHARIDSDCLSCPMRINQAHWCAMFLGLGWEHLVRIHRGVVRTKPRKGGQLQLLLQQEEAAQHIYRFGRVGGSDAKATLEITNQMLKAIKKVQKTWQKSSAEGKDAEVDAALKHLLEIAETLVDYLSEHLASEDSAKRWLTIPSVKLEVRHRHCCC
mmetsp:Transcript_60222/g.111647  ORF Transcript_60222/g.111647 Transcript_60222/m.111647 type:complete len:250 (-) Transcript_60222:211-960(-)